MSNELGLGELVAHQLTKQQAAWLTMAARKNELTATLQRYELDLQAILLNKPVDALPEALKAYKAKFAEMKDARLQFTNAVDAGIIQPLMAFEKRADPKVNEAYISAEKRELADRQAKASQLQKDQAKATEVGQFKAHFVNEYTRLVADLRLAYARITSEAYQHCLTARTPVDKVDSAIQIAISAMGEVKPGAQNKFSRVHIPDAEAIEIYKTIPVPDWASYLREAVEGINAKFSLYPNDLANAEQAVQAEVQTFQATVVETAQEVQQEMAATTLIAQAEAFVLPEPGFKGITETTRIKVVDDNQRWVLLITTAFIANFNSVFNKLRVKKYSALTVAQMAAALDAAGVKVDGVGYENIIK